MIISDIILPPKLSEWSVGTNDVHLILKIFFKIVSGVEAENS